MSAQTTNNQQVEAAATVHSQTTATPSSPAARSTSSTAPATQQSTQASSIDSLSEEQPPNPRLAALQAKKASLVATLSSLQLQRQDLVESTKLPSGLRMPDDLSLEQKSGQAMKSANSVIKGHIASLHRYNEIKDIAQGLMGMIADRRGERIGEVMESFGMGEKD